MGADAVNLISLSIWLAGLFVAVRVGVASPIVGVATVKVGKRLNEKRLSQDRGVATAAAAAASTAALASADPAQRLRKLADLRETGLISDEEFD